MTKFFYTAKRQKRRGLFIKIFSASLILCGSLLFSSAIVSGQKIAVLVPEKNLQTREFIEKLEASFPADVKVLDDDLSDAAYRAQTFDKPFNLTLPQAKTIGAAVGCDFFLLVKSETLRRVSLSRADYYESYATIFAASAQTGRLVFFKLESRDATLESEARANLFDAAKLLAAEIFERLKGARAAEQNQKTLPAFEALPKEDSEDAKNFRPPLPYKRLSPVYTSLANSFRVEATVDAEVDVDETGKITNIEIARWAGFGLDESVAENIRRMNWRHATRNDKAVSIRVLLRYNFKKVEAQK